MSFCADSPGRRSRAAGRTVCSSSGATADVAGAVGVFCNLSHDTISTASRVGHRNRASDTPGLAVHRTPSDPPALPPRAPIYNKNLSSQSCRQPRARSSNYRSSGSVISSGSIISPNAVKDAPSSELRDDALDVFIPLSGDEQVVRDGLDVTVGHQNKTDDQKLFTFNVLESEQTASVNISADGRKYLDSDQGDGLDVVVSTEDETDNEKQQTLNSSESASFTNVSAEGEDRFDDNKAIAEDHRHRYEQISKRVRPNVVRRLTRKETTKLSRKLTRKMSCRQQHALMMASEFDEFDELDVVVETGSIMDDDDEDDVDGRDGKSSSVGSDSEEMKNGDGLRNVDQIDATDAGFDQRVTTKLQYDQLQVVLFMYCNNLAIFCGMLTE